MNTRTAGSRKALIVVDVQIGFCEGGNLGITGGDAVAEKIGRVLLRAGHEYDVVALTLDWHVDPGEHFSMRPDFVNSWPAHCVAGTNDAKLHPAIRDGLRAESLSYVPSRHFYKGAYSAAYSGFEGADDAGVPLRVWLMAHRITAVDIVGLALDHCVAATAKDALKHGFDTTVLTDLTAAVNPIKAGDIVTGLRADGATILP